VSPHSISHNQQPIRAREADFDVTRLIIRMDGIGSRNREGILKDRYGFVEAHSMFPQVVMGLEVIPFKTRAPSAAASHENTRNHRSNSFFTPGVSLPRRQVSAAFLMTSPWVG